MTTMINYIFQKLSPVKNNSCSAEAQITHWSASFRSSNNNCYSANAI